MSLPTNLAKPNTMIAGTDALAVHVNSNFDYAIDALNTTNADVNTNTAEIVSARSGELSLDARIDSIAVTANAAMPANYLDTDATLSANSDTKVPSQKAVKAHVSATAFNSALPAQDGNAGKFVTTDGTNASWADVPAQSDTSRTYTGPIYTRDDDGTISGGTWAIDYANGPVIKATAGADITSITMSNWPTSGTGGHLRLMLVDFGAYTVTFPAWQWIKSDLTTTTSLGDLSLTLPSSGTAIVDLFSEDGGTTVYAKVLR